MTDDLRTRLHTAIDTETTGLEKGRDRIRSIAAVSGTVEHGIIHRLSLLVDTEGHPSHPEALAIHRIPDNLGGGLPIAAALAAVEALRNGTRVIMHNPSFDVGKIAEACERAGVALPDYVADPASIIDTMGIARSHYPGSLTNLTALARAAGIGGQLLKLRESRHDVLDDAILTFELWRRHALPTTLSLDAQPRAGQAPAPPMPQVPGGGDFARLGW